jgi:ABC-type nitrate/sulfonate/bicarbonate transport system ATPase subunit
MMASDMRTEPIIELQNVSFAYEYGSLVLSSLDFRISSGEIVALLGPSGCGKSTLLRVMGQLEMPDDGRISFDTSTQTGSRLLFQDYDAFPWLTVLENVVKGSGPAPYPGPEVVRSIIAAVDLNGFERHFPNELSGGMRKRLALARILVRKPSLVLLDEPFSSLDVDTRSTIYQLVQPLWETTMCGAVVVTHDVHEAILLATRIDVASPRPMRIKKSLSVPFARPRNESIVETSEYRDLHMEIVAAISNSAEPTEK